MSGGFEDLGLLPELVRATREKGWLLPSDVQDEAIPLILGGGDVMVAAETGSGKTGAFALPAIQLVQEIHAAAAAAAAAATAASTSSTTLAAAASAEAGAFPNKRARMGCARLNGNDRSTMLAVTEDGLSCQCRLEREWAGVRATRGVVKGKVYFEARICDEGLCRFGWSTTAASLDLGVDRSGYGFGGTGKKSNDRKFDTYGEPFGRGDTIGCYLDLEARTVSWSKNGRALGVAFSLPSRVGALYPALCMKNAECTVNFGASPFAHPPLSGYAALDAAPQDWLVSGADVADGEAVEGSGSIHSKGPTCVILAPKRDLAEQTHKELTELSRHVRPRVRLALIIGGVDSREIDAQLAAVPDIVTATPGKLIDIVESNKVTLSQVRLLVIDEADDLCSAENLEMIKKLASKMRAANHGTRVQVCFFSATLHSPVIGQLSDLLCQHPTWVDLKGKDSVPDTVHHVCVVVDPSADRSWLAQGGKEGTAAVPTDGVHAKDPISPHATSGRPLTAEEASEGVKLLKPRLLLSLFESLNMEQCLIFCRTNVDCNNLERFLTAVGGGQSFRAGRERGKENPFSCVVLAGTRSMEERRRNLEAFKAGEVRFLICTDVAARGLDIKELPYVVNLSLPEEAETYIHRIGRVGRADRMGLAVSFVATVKEKVWYHVCASHGKGCTNTRLKEQGGCTIWYDDAALLSAIKKRVGVDHIASLAVAPNPATGRSQFVLPPELATTSYGEERGGVTDSSAHVTAIRDKVAVLAALEVRAQSSFLALLLKYAPPVMRADSAV